MDPQSKTNLHNINSLLNPKFKNCYENIFSEFERMEKTTNEIFLMNKNNDYKRKTRIKMLEMKLQNYCEDVKNFNLLDVNKKLEDLTVMKSENVGKFLENCAGFNSNTNSNYSNSKYLNILHSNTNFDSNPVCSANSGNSENTRNSFNNKEELEILQQSEKEKEIFFRNSNNEKFSTPSSKSDKVSYIAINFK